MIREADPGEAAALTALALRSKAYWGYSSDFLARCRDLLTITCDEIRETNTNVLEVDGRLLGFYMLTGDDTRYSVAWIELLYVEPALIGGGVGVQLWRHAVETAQAQGYQYLHVESDPYAVGFYERLGMVQYATRESVAEPGRMLPLLVLDLL
ncbi:MAG: GNAT family N-acetyltransferase [Phototrophicaceae bacterium]